MKNSLKRIKAWRSRRQLRSLERWEQVRAKGQVRFVFETALTYSVTFIGITDVLNHVFPGGTQFSVSFIDVSYPITGLIIGLVSWSSMESKYRDALIEARVKAALSGAVPPQDGPLQITVDSESK